MTYDKYSNRAWFYYNKNHQVLGKVFEIKTKLNQEENHNYMITVINCTTWISSKALPTIEESEEQKLKLQDKKQSQEIKN